jgi:hypothetical protein
MKTALLICIVFCAAAAFGQGSVSSSQAQMLQLPDHPQHADHGQMATEQLLVGGGDNTYTYGHGEQPLWEFGPVSQPVPLGDIAREYRKQKMLARKAVVVLDKEGS